MLLGFDIRCDNPREWDAKRKDQFLFRSDVIQPFSTDTTVWPSCCDMDQRPAECIGHQDLWSDLKCLKEYASSREYNDPHSSTIAIAVHLANLSEPEVMDWKSEATLTNPSMIGASWTLLGYDVSDRWLLSGLSNCGFLPEMEDVQSLRDTWANKLNERHLFDVLDYAIEFRELSNKRVAEHAPFFIFGIWSL